MICRKTSIMVGTSVTFAALALLLLTSGASALSNSGGGSWQYNKDITISNTGNSLTDYQVLVGLTGGYFPTTASYDGADIRFTDANGNELSYWIESWDYAGKSGKIWVKVPSIPAVGTTIRMHYRNPSASSSSNGDATFEFFDDFEGTSLDTAKWNVNAGAKYLVSNGVIKIAGNSWGFDSSDFGIPAIYSKLGFNDYIINARVTHDTENSLGDINYWLVDIAHYYGIQHETRGNLPNDLVFKNGVSEGWLVSGYEYEWNVNDWVRYSIKVHSNIADFERISETDSTKKSTGNNIDNPESFATTNRKIGLSGDALNGNFIVDWILVRKYASPEPSVSMGVEQSSNGLVAEYHFDGDAKDSSGNGNDGTINGGATFVDGMMGRALSFDGVDDYVKINQDNSWQVQDLTIELWIKPGSSQLHPHADIIGSHSQRYQGPSGWVIEQDGYVTNKFSFAYGAGANWQGGMACDFFVNLNANVWQHLVATKSNTYLKIYLNGRIEDTCNTTNPTIYYGSVNPELFIGDWFEHDRQLNGNIDEVRIYNRALSADEIKAEYEKYASTLTSITVSPSTATVVAGKTQVFTATDQNGNDITTKVTWSSGDTSVGTISINGKFTALKVGTAVIKATNSGISGSASVTVSNPLQITKNIKGVWLYDLNKYDTDTLIDNLKSRGINTVILSVDVNNVWDYERFVKSAHEKNINVHALILQIADNENVKDYTNFYSESGHKNKAVQDVEKILEFNKNSLATFDGINIDLEPYTSDIWNSNRPAIWIDYVNVINAIHEKTKGKTVLSVDIPHWYDKSQIGDLTPNLDFFAIMAYDGGGWNKASIIEDKVASEMGSMRGEGSKAVIGIGAHEGFKDKGAVDTSIRDLSNYYSNDPSFLGVSIFDYKTYEELPIEENQNLPQPKEPKSIPGFETFLAIIALGLFLIIRRGL